MGLFAYERILNQVVSNIWFKEAGWEYYIGGFVIKRYAYQDWLILTIGVTFLGYYFITKQREVNNGKVT